MKSWLEATRAVMGLAPRTKKYQYVVMACARTKADFAKATADGVYCPPRRVTVVPRRDTGRQFFTLDEALELTREARDYYGEYRRRYKVFRVERVA